MRVDPASTTDTERSPSHPPGAGADLALVWVAPEPHAPVLFAWADAEERLIGREEDSAIVLPGSDVSRRHAAVRRVQAGFSIMDLGSRNSTRVNGRPIRSALLGLGDVVRIGPWIGVVSSSTEPFSEIFSGLYGGGALKRALAPLQQAATSDLPVIIEGETGTGKELAARAIHAWSGRTGPLVAVNCAALPESLAEAELFGYRRGAFTGAERASPGYIRSAEGGTLLLDEITDLSLVVQAKLLRALEQREVQPLGEPRPVPVDVRVVAAGQQNLLDAVRERRFRADLVARLDGVSVRLPPLRERREDVPELFTTLWAAAGGARPECDLDFLERLCTHDWPLNVRELVLLARRLRVFCENEPKLRAYHLPARIGNVETPEEGAPDKLVSAALDASAPGLERPELGDLVVALRSSGGNVARAAALLGITRQRAYRLLDEHAVDLESFRK